MKPSVYAKFQAFHPAGPAPEAAGKYASFQSINGNHPWRYAAPSGFIDYPVRILPRSKVVYFNFALAKEMELIAKDHPNTLNKELEKTLLETFALRIVNEYDQLAGTKFPEKKMKNHRYMATRYLQLQHLNKQGNTSGDGRSIWNGQFISAKGNIWDLSSCGTGVTRLSPGSVEEGRPIRTGEKLVSYGSGLADVDEGLTAAILSESFHSRKILTERTLLVIETPSGHGINVRVAKNLLRPSHLFLYLKQGNQLTLKSALDFYIARQITNRAWPSIREGEKYETFLRFVCERYAEFAAKLEDEYIFCWLDWDGDNMLLDGGIIDYGSIRQFGLCHHKYRYDDVARLSTNLKEQKKKAKQLVQTFIQLVDFVRTGEKKELGAYSSHPILQRFEQNFRTAQLNLLLKRVGLSPAQRKTLIRNQLQRVEEFEESYRFFERKERGNGLRRTPDGINDPAIFCLRSLLKNLPQKILLKETALSTIEFLSLMKTPYLTKKEMGKVASYDFSVKKFQQSYLDLIRVAHKGKPLRRAVLEVAMRASQYNQTAYVTGDGIIYVVDELLKKKGQLSKNEFIRLIDAYIHWQTNDKPGVKLKKNTKKALEKIIQITQNHRHTL